MYIIEDRVTPAIQGYMNLLRTKNIILNYWPTKEISISLYDPSETIKVFDKLYFYNGSIIEDDLHKKLYHLLNIKVQDLKDAEYKGVESAWLELNGNSFEDIEIAIPDMENYIDLQLPVDSEGYSEWITIKDIIYDPMDLTAPSYVTDADIVNYIQTERTNTHYDVEKAHEFLALVLLDRDNEFFEAEYTVTSKQLTERFKAGVGKSTYILSASVDVKFRRKVATGTAASDSYLSKLKSFIEELDNYEQFGNIVNSSSSSTNYKNLNKAAEVSKTLSINKQLYSFLSSVVPISETALVYPVPYGLGSINYIKYDGMAALTPTDFSIALAKFLDTGFSEEDIAFWKKVLIIVVTVAIVVISAGYAAAAVAASSAATTAAALVTFASTMALGLAIGQLALALIAKLFANKGNYATAAFIGGSLQVLGMISTILGIIAVTATTYEKLVSFLSSNMSTSIVASEVASGVITNVGGAAAAGVEAATTSLVDKLFNAVQEMVTGYIKKNLAGPMDFITGFVTDAFNVYSKYIDPPNEGLDEKQRTINEQKEELEQLSATQDNSNKVQYLFESPYANIYDFNEYMQNIPYLMTQGKIESSFTKYYS